jgi:hypothetical protein
MSRAALSSLSPTNFECLRWLPFRKLNFCDREAYANQESGQYYGHSYSVPNLVVLPIVIPPR